MFRLTDPRVVMPTAGMSQNPNRSAAATLSDLAGFAQT